MAHRSTIALIASGVLLAAAPNASAQRRGEEPRDGVCFYEHEDFRGDFFCARTGEDGRFMPSGWNDRISSIRVYGNAEVIVYRDGRLEGPSERFSSDARNLGDEWNDQISSFQVRRASSRGYRRDSDERGGYGSRYEDADRIIRRAYQRVFDREPDNAGLRAYRDRVVDDGWGEGQIREDLRKSSEFRRRAEDMVRRAYLAVLKREPDAGGRSYVERIVRDEWSQQDVERELRQSAEYRNRR